MSRFLYLPNNVIAKQKAIQAGTRPMYLRMSYDKYIMRFVWASTAFATGASFFGVYRAIIGYKPPKPVAE